jgi:hypothetical protein
MKLKLEELDSGPLLSVSESIEAEQVAVIRAGLANLLKKGAARVLVDLSAIPEEQLRGERLISEFVALKAWAACQDREVLVAAPLTELGDAPTREALFALASDPQAREAAQLGACRAYAAKLERQKHALEKKVSALEPGASSLRKLRKQNSDLRKRIAFAEAEIRRWVTTRNAAGSFEENAARLRTAERTLAQALESKGIQVPEASA